MSDIAIRAENLSKQYRIGKRQRYKTARESFIGSLKQAAAIVRGDRQKSTTETFWALSGVTFDVPRGEVIGIIGRNGAGKSTLLKILSRICEPTAGRVEIDGRVGSLLEVGTGFHPELTGRENVYLNGAILGMRRSEIARKFDEIVAFAEVEQFLDTPVKHYSSGMYTRLAFAVAANLEPEILIVDEVLAVGDAVFQRKCLGKMKEVGSSGRTVLFVSHTMPAIEQLCDRVLLLSHGKVEAIGSTESIISKYLSDATQSTTGVFDLAVHPARASQREPVIRSVVLSSGHNPPTTELYPDEPMTAQLRIEPTRPIRTPRVAMSIEDSFGRRLTSVASFFGDHPIPDLESPCTISCEIPRLRLGPGRYLLSVSIGDAYNGLIDEINGFGWFDVGWRNNFGNGELFSPVYGPVLTESTWHKTDA